jgi:hypothetical protein
MKNTYKIIFLVSLLLVLAGCGGGGGSNLENSNWKVGTEGVTMNFLESSPPNDVYAGEEYSLVLEMRNKGNYPDNDDDDLDVTLFFSGFSRNLIGLDDDDTVSIEGGLTQTNPLGGETYYETDFDVELYSDADSIPQNLKVTACYGYETKAAIDVCVDPDPIKNDEDTCSAGTTGGVGSQAAPIAVTAVSQQSLKGKVRFIIKIQNVGPGTVFDGSQCLNPAVTDKNVVFVDAVYLGDDELECSPDEKVRLSNGVGTITCTADDLNEGDPAYIESLGVHLVYNYKNSISKTMTVKRIE